MFRLFNTLNRKIEDFSALNPPYVGMYTCGPTVYDYTHIGHLRKYVGDDILRRVLEEEGYQVKHVMNVTDVGHLTSDADQGDDKLEKGAKEKGMTVWQVAKFFEDYFFKSQKEINNEYPNVVARATEHIKEQIKLIQMLEKRGFTYQTSHGVYFDISKFPTYTNLTGQKLEEKVVGARQETVVDKDKKNPADFVLWFFTIGRFADHVMRWPSPWGEGFPGWHIECSAMSMEYLGNTLDIHTGGLDHLTIHHPNEIAQSEAATSHKFVRFWVHHGWLLVNGQKMSKSKKNFYTIDDIKEKGFDPLSLRYLFLTTHYRDELNFSWGSLEAAQNALNNLREEIRRWDEPKIGCAEFEQRFTEAIDQDLNMPQALAILWETVKADYPYSAKAQTILKMDKILGLKLDEYLGKPVEVPEEVMQLIRKRQSLRKSKDYKEADKIRKEIKKLGFEVKDTNKGEEIKKIY